MSSNILEMNKQLVVDSVSTMSYMALQAERVRFLYQQAKTSLIGHLLSSSGVMFVFYNYVDKVSIWIWFCSILLVTSIRYASVFYFHKKQPQDEEMLKWGWFFTFMVFLTGCFWGAASYLFLLYDHPHLTLFMVMVLTGMLVASLASLSVFMWAYYAFAVPTGLPLIIELLTQGSSEYQVYGLLITLFVLVLMAYARVNQKTVDQSIILRNENVELVHQLQQQKENAERLTKEAEAANLAKTRFLASASHDLRQPLHAMGLFIDVLAECRDEIERVQIIDKVRKSGSALENLLESLLDISKLDAGAITVSKEPFELQSVLDALAAEFESMAKDKRINISFAKTSVWVDSDIRLVDRILRNFISNAIRYTSRGGVLVGCRRKGQSILLSVCDTGSGFSEDQKDLIFSEFQQLENPERDRTKGLGLGLAIVNRLAGLLKADIHVKSVLGKGAMFAVELPICQKEECAQQPQQKIATPLDLSGKHIVVVDDESDIRDGLSSLLSSWGCHVCAISSVADARSQLTGKEVCPDLVLADYRLRDNETGVDVIHEIQSMFANDELPAVIITGDTAPDRIKEAKASGFEILHKPIAGGRLRATLNALLLAK